jgi:purine-binding chemotaxis protein CheW
MRPLPITQLPAAPSFVRGLSLIRGVAVPVVDLGALLEAPGPEDPTRFIAIRLNERRVALAVERVLGIRQVPGRLNSLPPLLAAASAEAVSAIGAHDAELLLVLRAARLVPDTVWREVDAASAG